MNITVSLIRMSKEDNVVNNLVRSRLLVFMLEHSHEWVSHKQAEDHFNDVDLDKIWIQIVKEDLVDIQSVCGAAFFRYKQPNYLERDCFTL
jgi:hypothetical protein